MATFRREETLVLQVKVYDYDEQDRKVLTASARHGLILEADVKGGG